MTAASANKTFRPLLWAGCALLLFGCGSKESNSVPQSVPPPRPLHSTLQREVDRLKALPLECDPNKRPLVLSQRAPTRREWALRALETGYQDSGHTNGRWDAAVHSAFEAFADYTRGNEPQRTGDLFKAIDAAQAAGCDDPMMRYFVARYRMYQTNLTARTIAFLRADEAMLGSHYHPVFKFMAGLRGVEAARQLEPKGNRSIRIDFTQASLEDLARDTNAPAGEVFDAVSMWINYASAKGWADYVLTNLQGILEKNWGQEEAWLRIQGEVEIKRAWDARGGGWAQTVTPEGYKKFQEHLSEAEQYLKRAWELNPTNAYTAYMRMQVELGQGRGRAVMDEWFNRAMALDTNYLDAAKLMSFYLEPRWYGSEEDALEFARQCVASTNWGGQVPLVLPDLHVSLANYYNLSNSPSYWHRPQVWEDVHSAYEKFFQLNPDAYGWRHNYARHAYWCGQYKEFLAQTKLFSGGTNYSFFGGKSNFDQMLAHATAAVAAGGE